jgi:hypothetical protein
VDARALTEQQRYRLSVTVADHRDYYKRLRARMDAVGWDQACPAYLAAVAAQDAAQAVLVALWDTRPPVATLWGPRKSDAHRAAPVKPPGS